MNSRSFRTGLLVSLVYFSVLVYLSVLVGLAGCGGPKRTVNIDPGIQLTVKFVDAEWDGRNVPYVGRCGECGGKGRSPALLISGLPPQANEVVVEFNDLRIRDLAKNGGHGTLAIGTGGQPEVFLPSVNEETMKLPRGVRCVRKHRCVFFGHKAGAYKAPCGCGQGNEYVAKVMAVVRDGESFEVIAQKVIEIGVF